jgi:hypothetical protein
LGTGRFFGRPTADPESSSALLWFSIILILISLVAMSPDLSFLLLSLSILCAARPTLLGPARRHRILGAIVLIISLALWIGPLKSLGS